MAASLLRTFLWAHKPLLLKAGMVVAAVAALEAGFIAAIRNSVRPESLQGETMPAGDYLADLFPASGSGQEQTDADQNRTSQMERQLAELNGSRTEDDVDEWLSRNYLSGGITDEELDFIISVAAIPEALKQEIKQKKEQARKLQSAVNKVLTPERLSDRSTRFPP